MLRSNVTIKLKHDVLDNPNCSDMSLNYRSLNSLPFYPYMSIEVTPLCRHPGALPPSS
jgi:muconolactone delta-isomerase